METSWKRPKTLPSTTEHIDTQCGTLHFTIVKEDDKLVEVRGMIGKSGTCGNVFLDTICKMVSMYLQSPEPRYKICKKFRKQFVDMNCGQGKFVWEGEEYTGCIDYVIKRVVKELGE